MLSIKSQLKQISLSRILWIVFLFLWSLGQLQRIQIGQRLAFYLHDVVIVVWLLIYFHRLIKSRLLSGTNSLHNFVNQIGSQYKQELLFLGWGAVTLIISTLQFGFRLNSWLYFARLISYLIFGLSLRPMLNLATSQSSDLNSSNPKLLSIGTTAVGLLTTVVSVSWYIFMPDMRFLARFGWDPHFYRLMGPILDPNFTGLILIMFMVIWFWQALNNNLKFLNLKQSKLKKILIDLIIFLTTLAVSLTFSRSSYLSLLTVLGGFFAMNWVRNQQNHKNNLSKSNYFPNLPTYKTIFLAGLIFIISLPLLPKPGGEGVNLARTSTIEQRAAAGQTALSQIHGVGWLTGVGFFKQVINADIKHDRPVHAHFPDSLPIFVLTQTGLVGVTLATLLLIKWFQQLYPQKPYALILLLAVLSHSLANLSLFEPFSLLYLLMCLNTVSSSRNREEQRKFEFLE